MNKPAPNPSDVHRLSHASPGITSFERDGRIFNLRVAGVARRRDEVLLQTDSQSGFWILPGGRPNLGEQTRDTLRREMQEELDTGAHVGGLLWVVENFFEGVHELLLIFAIEFAPDSNAARMTERFSSQEPNSTISFEWFRLGGLSRLRLYPSFLRTALQSTPDHTVHVVIQHE